VLHFSSLFFYFQNPNFNSGFNPTFRIIILLLLSLLFLFNAQTYNANMMRIFLSFVLIHLLIIGILFYDENMLCKIRRPLYIPCIQF
jgi:hypothetical protein